MTESGIRKLEKTAVIKIVEAVDRFEAPQEASCDLRHACFSRHDISLQGNEKALKEKLGDTWWRTEDLKDAPDVPRASFVREEAIGEMDGRIICSAFFILFYVAMATAVASGGAVAAVAMVAIPAAVIGVQLARREDRHHRDCRADQVERGGIPLWVRVADKRPVKPSVGSLKAYSGKDAHVHDWSL